jgi:hypothetical protein
VVPGQCEVAAVGFGAVPLVIGRGAGLCNAGLEVGDADAGPAPLTSQGGLLVCVGGHLQP